MRKTLFAVLLCLPACEHSQPFTTAGPDSLPPASATLPRRLTYSLGDDRQPSVGAGRLVFSRLELPEATGSQERCLAYLPPDGGTILAEPCPPLVPQTPADTFLDTWTEPVLSPDGRRVAFMWQQGSLVAVLGFTRISLVVAPAGQPTDPHRFVWQILMTLPGNRYGDSVQKIAWVDDHRLRFLICHEYIFKVKAGTVRRYTDTTFIPYGLAELDLETGTAALVPGGDSVSVWAPAPDGGAWVTFSSDPARVWHLGSAGDTVSVAVFSDTVVDLVSLAGWPAALLAYHAGDTARVVPGDTSRIEWVDAALGTPHEADVAAGMGPVRRMASVPGTRRLVVEIERGDSVFGAPANLWLYEVP